MRRGQRLTREADFGRVHQRGRSWPHQLVVLRSLANGLPRSRFGFSVSKRVGKAVVRNRVKRRLREAARLQAVRPGWDLVFIARQPIAEARFQEVLAAVEAVLRRARLLEGQDGGGVPE